MKNKIKNIVFFPITMTNSIQLFAGTFLGGIVSLFLISFLERFIRLQLNWRIYYLLSLFVPPVVANFVIYSIYGIFFLYCMYSAVLIILCWTPVFSVKAKLMRDIKKNVESRDEKNEL